MATVVLEPESQPSCSLPNAVPPSPSLSHRFLDSKFYLLVVIGELVTEEHLRRAIANIERDPHFFLESCSAVWNKGEAAAGVTEGCVFFTGWLQ